MLDPEARVTLCHYHLHQNVDYTPYDGMELHGCPVLTLRRGQAIVRDGEFIGARGAGEFLRRAREILMHVGLRVLRGRVL